MGIQKEIQAIEMQIFDITTNAFDHGRNKQLSKLSICLEAIKQLEKDYEGLTKKNFSRPENIVRLNAMYDELKAKLPKADKFLTQRKTNGSNEDNK